MPEYLPKAPKEYDSARIDGMFDQVLKKLAEVSSGISVIASLNNKAIGGLAENRLYLHTDPNQKNVDLVFVSRGRLHRIVSFSQDTGGQFSGLAYTQTYATKTQTHAARTASSLTDSTGGTSDTTVAAVPNPSDSPATADILRDDLVANVWPTLQNNFADLVAMLNKVRTDAENTAQVLNSTIDDLQIEGTLR